MPTYSNVHATLDNEEIHVPRDFSLAANDTLLTKNALGGLRWQDTYWQAPVIGVVDAMTPPPIAVDGDRYILTIGSTAICSSIDTTAISSTAVDTSACVHPGWDGAELNAIVEYFALDADGNAIEQWQAIDPKAGYRVHNLADDQQYYYDGTAWLTDTTIGYNAPVSFQYTLTRSALLSKQAAGELEPGARYYIADRDIILTATTNAQFALEGDHTRALPAHGYVDLQNIWTRGSITEVLLNGTSLLTAPVAFSGDLAEDVTSAADVINGQFSATGIYAIDALDRLILLDMNGSGSAANGLQFQMLVDGDTLTSTAFVLGADAGDNWFKVRYDLQTDELLSMSDARGNVVSITSGFIDDAGIDPFLSFPWAYDKVQHNKVHNSLLQAFTTTGEISNNQLTEAFVGATAFAGTLKANSISSNSSMVLTKATSQVQSNTIQAFASLVAPQVSFSMQHNELITSVLDLTGAAVLLFKDNSIRSTSLNMMGFNSTEPFNLNTIVNCGDMALTNGSGRWHNNQLNESSINGVSSTTDVSNNQIGHSVVDFSNAVNAVIEYNRIERDTELTMVGAACLLRHNTFEQSELNLNGAAGSIEFNTVTENSTIDLSNFTGSNFNYNQVRWSTMLMPNASAQVDGNQLFSSTINLPNYSGTYFRQNDCQDSSIEGGGCSGNIYNNRLINGVLEVASASGDFGANNVLRDSTVNGNGYAGVRCIFSTINGTSTLDVSNSVSEIARLRVEDETMLDLTMSVAPHYGSKIRVPGHSLILNNTQLTTKITKSNSSYEKDYSISDGIIDFNQDGYRFAGEIRVTNDSNLSQLNGLSYAPNSIRIYPDANSSVTLDSSAVSNIRLPQGVSSLTIYGSNGDFIDLIHNGIFASVKNIYKY